MANSLQVKLLLLLKRKMKGELKSSKLRMPEKNLFANKHKLNVLEEKKQHLPLLHAKNSVCCRNERRAKREAELANDKKRDQAYEDELRKLQLESMKLELQAKRLVSSEKTIL
ncbi:Uncharacterised protein [Escherichia coli]|uniref:Uncharacterized protein n=1 Tax=Escherichia coli TaxID=562 RepID=A0A376YJK9_ECOLX|nr:Uncharacterised protein [Escherichia coli]